LEVEARDGAPSARPNSNQQPNSGKHFEHLKHSITKFWDTNQEESKNDKNFNFKITKNNIT
jgi:hypothetical protein